MTLGPKITNSVNRLHPIDDARYDEERHQKRKVRFNGRDWAEEEEKLTVQPMASSMTTTGKGMLYLDEELGEKATEMFNYLTTLEEKIAQFFFLEIEATYDKAVEKLIEDAIQDLQIGGLFFSSGELKRANFLIEHCKELSKTPLFIGQSFQMSLHLYLPHAQIPYSAFDRQKYIALGSELALHNRQRGIQIQFENSLLSDEENGALRQGIRQKRGIVGSFKLSHKTVKSITPTLSNQPIFSDHKIQDAIGRKSLTFFSCTETDSIEAIEEALLTAYKQHFDLFVLKENPALYIQAFKNLVLSNKIREEGLDTRLMKLLAIKIASQKNYSNIS